MGGRGLCARALRMAGGALWVLLLTGSPQFGFCTDDDQPEEASATAPAEAEPEESAALPEADGPWAIPALEELGMLVILPLRDETGTMSEDGRYIQKNIARPWQVAAPPGIGVVDIDTIRSTLVSMTPASHRYDPDDQTIRDAVTFWGGTHVLSGRYSVGEDSSLTVEVSLATPDGVKERAFTVPPKNGLALARDVSSWMVEASGWPIPDRERRVLETKPWGAPFDTVGNDLLQALAASGSAPEWESVLAENSDDPLLKAWRADLLEDEGNDEKLAQMDPGPLPADAPAWERNLRARALMAKKDFEEARLEVETLLATRPGAERYVTSGLFTLLPKEKAKDHHVRGHIAAKWHGRAPKSCWSDAVLAQTYGRIAWQYRGTGWAKDVTPERWRFFAEYNGKALPLFDGVVDRCGPIPWVCQEMMSIHGPDGNSAETMRILTACSSRYPDSVDTWNCALNYMRPRWGGSDAEVVHVVDRALASSGNWIMGSLAMNYCQSEADLEFKEEQWGQRMIKFCNAHPELEQLLRRSADYCMDNANDEREAFAWAASTAVAVQDFEWLKEIVARRPDLWRSSRDHFPRGWDGFTLYKVEFILFMHGDWEEHRAMLEAVIEQDAHWRAQPKGSSHVVNTGNEQSQHFMLGFAETMTGDAEKGIARMFAAEQRLGWHGIILSASMLIADKEVEVVAGNIGKLSAEAPENRDLKAVLALARWRQGKKEEAVRLIDEAQNSKAKNELGGMYPAIRHIIETGEVPARKAEKQ